MPFCAQLARSDFVTASGFKDASHGELWVFGYGSLMWRPGFTYALRRKAMLRGWRRSLCIYSHHYRGTPDRPGLVLGLDRGGACPGVAFRIDAALREPTIRYLREREQVTAVYLERMVPIVLESGERVSALTFVADRTHRQYAGRLTREAMLERVRAGTGALGDNAAYVTETCDHLVAIGVRDRDLEWLSARLRSDGS
jgi:glutathione-specific gamma-glutamylcyclotransferase